VWHSKLALHPPKIRVSKAKKEDSSDEECSNDDSDDEALALFVRKFGKMMKKKA
jgi:hypothetical protein